MKSLSDCALDALLAVLTTKVDGDRMMLLGGPKEWVVPLMQGLRELREQGLVELEQGFMNGQAVWTIDLVDRARARATLVAARSESVFFTVQPPARLTPLASPC